MCENGWEVPPRNKWGCAVWLLRKSILNDMDKNILKLYLEFCEFKRSMTPYCEVHQQFPPFHFYNGTLNLSFPAYKLRKIASWLEAVPIVTDLIRTSWILMVWINNEKSGYFDLTWVTYIVEPLLFMYVTSDAGYFVVNTVMYYYCVYYEIVCIRRYGLAVMLP